VYTTKIFVTFISKNSDEVTFSDFNFRLNMEMFNKHGGCCKPLAIAKTKYLSVVIYEEKDLFLAF
jgi:hypothetical protein